MKLAKSAYIIVLVSIISCFEIVAQGEGGVFTQSRLSALKTGEGSLGNNPQAIEWFNELKLKTSVLGTEQKISLDDIEGSVYFNEYFVKGHVFYNEKPYEEFYIRYDAYNDEVELRRFENGQIEALHKNGALSCTIGNDHLVFREFRNEKNELKNGYVFEYFEGNNLKVFKRRVKIFKEAKEANTSLQGSFPHRFLNNETYVIALNEMGTAKETKNLKRFLLQNLNKFQSKKLKTLIKTENIDFELDHTILYMLGKLDSEILGAIKN